MSGVRGSHRPKNTGILWNTFINGDPPPPYCIYEILIQILPLILGYLLFLNKRYEIRLTPPPRLWNYFIKFRYFFNDGFPNSQFIFLDNFRGEKISKIAKMMMMMRNWSVSNRVSVQFLGINMQEIMEIQDLSPPGSQKSCKFNQQILRVEKN